MKHWLFFLFFLVYYSATTSTMATQENFLQTTANENLTSEQWILQN